MLVLTIYLLRCNMCSIIIPITGASKYFFLKIKIKITKLLMKNLLYKNMSKSDIKLKGAMYS